MFGFFNPSTIINPSFCNSRYLDWQAHFWDSSSRYWMSAVPMMNNCFSTFGFGMPHPADTMMRYNQTGPNFSSSLFGNNWSFMGWNGSTLGASTSNQSTDSSTSDENKQYKNLRALLNKIKENEDLSDDERKTIQQALDEANGAGSAKEKLDILQGAYSDINTDIKEKVLIDKEKSILSKAGYVIDNTKTNEQIEKFKKEIDSLTPSNYNTNNAKNLIRGTNIIDFICSWNDSNETDIITYLENRKEKTKDANIDDEIDNVIKLIFDELVKEAKKLSSELKEGDYNAISCLFNFVGGNITKAEQITMLYSAVRSAKRNILEYELNKKYSENTEISDKICADLDTDLESELKKICDKNNWGDYETFNYKGLNFTHKDAKVEKAEEETATEVVAGGEAEVRKDPSADPEKKIEDYDDFFKGLSENDIMSAATDGSNVARYLSGFTNNFEEEKTYDIIMGEVNEQNVLAFLKGYRSNTEDRKDEFFKQLITEDDFDPTSPPDEKDKEETGDKVDCLKHVLSCLIANLDVVNVEYKSELNKKIEKNNKKKPAEAEQLRKRLEKIDKIIKSLKKGCTLTESDCENIDKQVSKLFADANIRDLLKIY